jgi:hypothetical protein
VATKKKLTAEERAKAFKREFDALCTKYGTQLSTKDASFLFWEPDGSVLALEYDTLSDEEQSGSPPPGDGL